MANENKEKTKELFNKRVEEYESFVHGTVISYAEMVSTIREMVNLFCGHSESPRILDLGAGTGNTSKAALEAKPKASVLAFDVSDKMAECANKRFKGFDFKAVCDDVINLDRKNEFDLAVSSIVYHHLSDADKQKAYKKVYDSLKQGGAFILADVMASDSKELNEYLHSKWAGHMEKENGKEFRDKILSIDGKHHQYASLNNNLKFLNAAGFKTEVAYRNLNSSIIIGFK
ncbi:MAG: methyltransferase domain-containing protein [Candidatus Diapherotrites archaeon]